MRFAWVVTLGLLSAGAAVAQSYRRRKQVPKMRSDAC